MSRLYRKLFCFIIVAIVMMPLIFTAVDFGFSRLYDKKLFNEQELFGAVEIPPRPSISISGLMSGQFQTEFEKYLEYNLTLRKSCTRIYNQILYSIFDSTDRQRMLVGRNNYIYEASYPEAYLTEVSPELLPALSIKINDLEELNRLLKERGVVMVIRISPTKAEHYPEYLPSGYTRFVDMKRRGEYGPNWYKVFKDEIAKTDIPFYDRYDLIEQMKQDGHIVFTKGGIHWSQYPLPDYINGLNAVLEELLGEKLGRITVTSSENRYGVMGMGSDRDIWDICWNALYAEPDYLSPKITLDTTPGEFTPKVFTVGQSFTPIMLNAIYYNIKNPVWSETDFSWYNSYVLRYPNPVNLPWGERAAEETNDFEQYLSKDVIIIEFLETTAAPSATQFEFVSNMLNYLKSEGK